MLILTIVNRCLICPIVSVGNLIAGEVRTTGIAETCIEHGDIDTAACIVFMFKRRVFLLPLCP